jgi:small-conductance mechanosensitive channel
MIQAIRSVLEENSTAEYLTAAAILAAGALIVTFLRRRSIVLRFFRSRAEAGDEVLAPFVVRQYMNGLIPLAYVAVAYAAVASLRLTPGFRHGLNLLAGAVVVVTVFRFLAALSVFSIHRYVDAREAEREGSGRSIRALVPVVEIGILGVGLIFLLENFGFHVEAIVAGLGIGAVAVALAAQSLLKDVFGYVAIVLDRPFELGDTIQIDTLLGTVEFIGLKTTHVRSVSGEQLVFANSDLTTSRVRNWKRLRERRIVVPFTVAPATSAATLREIPGTVRAAVESQAGVRFERASLVTFADNGFGFDVVYYVLSPDYAAYAGTQHEINVAIKDAFERHGISFASLPQPAQARLDPAAAAARDGEPSEAMSGEDAAHALEQQVTAGTGEAQAVDLAE